MVQCDISLSFCLVLAASSMSTVFSTTATCWTRLVCDHALPVRCRMDHHQQTLQAERVPPEAYRCYCNLATAAVPRE